MDAKELRIGNYVRTKYDFLGDKREKDSKGQYPWLPIIITTVSDGEDYSDYHGTPLTGYWLSRLGFVNRVTTHLNYFELKVKDGLIRIEGLDVYFWKGLLSKEWYYDEGWHMPITHRSIKLETKYVHQLQNLYFVLTGDELAIND